MRVQAVAKQIVVSVEDLRGATRNFSRIFRIFRNETIRTSPTQHALMESPGSDAWVMADLRPRINMPEPSGVWLVCKEMTLSL